MSMTPESHADADKPVVVQKLIRRRAGRKGINRLTVHRDVATRSTSDAGGDMQLKEDVTRVL